MKVFSLFGLAISCNAFRSRPSRRTSLKAPFLVLDAKRVPRAVSSVSDGAGGAGPKAAAAVARRRPAVVKRRAPHQFDHTKEKARPFVDSLTEIQQQLPNEDGPVLDFGTGAGVIIDHVHIETVALDDIVPGMSRVFACSADFRSHLRQAMREDMFDTTAAYQNLPKKARHVLLLPDSSLQGSWKCRDWLLSSSADDQDKSLRMQRLTAVLQEYLGPTAPNGDEFMELVGSLCGSEPLTHWIDIVGVQNRKIPHSWHQDTGRSDQSKRTVLFGFPPSDEYDGVGVFSHVVKLKRELWAAEKHHSANEPVLHKDLVVNEEFIVRPRFAEGRELIVYRDVDVLHSSPDVAHRASVMRFM